MYNSKFFELIDDFLSLKLTAPAFVDAIFEIWHSKHSSMKLNLENDELLEHLISGIFMSCDAYGGDDEKDRMEHEIDSGRLRVEVERMLSYYKNGTSYYIDDSLWVGHDR